MSISVTPPVNRKPVAHSERWRATDLIHKGEPIFVSDQGDVKPAGAVRRMERRLFIGREPVARAVWRAFCGEIESGLQIHHVSGDSKDNRLVNLALVSQSAHARIEARGFRQYIPAAAIIEAVELHADGLTIDEIHNLTGLDHRTIRHAVHQADRRADVLELAFQGVHRREKIRDLFGAEACRAMMMESNVAREVAR